MVARQHIVMFSGGIGSWATAKRVAKKRGTKNLILLFADTLIEDEDLYRFLEEAAKNVGGKLVKVAEGRDPWQVFKDERFIGNSRVDPCSKILKRRFLRRWLEKNCDPDSTTVHLGIDWSEIHRFENAQEHWVPWKCEAPLCDRPYRMKQEMLADLEAEGIKQPRLYDMGFPHNNCGGFCIKAGQAHFKRLLEVMPERFAYHEKKELELAAYLGKDVAILTDRRGGKRRPLTLKALRERVECGGAIDEHDWGGCGCVA